MQKGNNLLLVRVRVQRELSFQVNKIRVDQYPSEDQEE